MNTRTLYPTDLSDAEWGVLQPLVPADKPGSQPEKYAKRDILNGILYSLRSGCAWRLLPHQLPPWRSVYHYCRLWRNDACGETTGLGNAFMIDYQVICASSKGARASPVQAASMRNRSK
ncbi:hypothetical protein C2W62_20185 [Candidatus Entotheonella serta]|nr:hypothetical protein C2W62_20185 [Candidatus Entotheonella serta]